MKIDGSVALVTGANRGLGRAYARELVGRGAAKVYGAARDVTAVTQPGVTRRSRRLPAWSSRRDRPGRPPDAVPGGVQVAFEDVDPEEVRAGYLGSLAVRSALTWLPTHLLAEPHADGAENTWVQRIELTRVIADLAADVARTRSAGPVTGPGLSQNGRISLRQPTHGFHVLAAPSRPPSDSADVSVGSSQRSCDWSRSVVCQGRTSR
jgi:hypothetical protein